MCNRAVITVTAVATLLTGLGPFIAGQAVRGAIEGRVAFVGTPPSPVVAEGGSQPVLYLDSSGGLQFALVFLPDARGEDLVPGTAATLHQHHFIFEPQVLAVRAGQVVRFTNGDPANHNVRAQDSNPANTFSISTASGAVGPALRRFVATPPDHPLELSCDIHPWMIAWLYVFDHGHFAVTDATGHFRIANVAPGHYRLAVRQPAGRLQRDIGADVTPGGTTSLEVRFTTTDLGMPAR
jgi:plastocyanin